MYEQSFHVWNCSTNAVLHWNVEVFLTLCCHSACLIKRHLERCSRKSIRLAHGTMLRNGALPSYSKVSILLSRDF